MKRLLYWLCDRTACRFLGTVASVLGIGTAVAGLFDDSGSDYQDRSINAAEQANLRMAEIQKQYLDMSKEQWDIYKNEALPIIREMAGMRTTPDRTAEEVALAAGDVKDAYAGARGALERTAGQFRNPGDPGYSALLAPSYLDEAAKVSGAITDARRAERARVEDTNWGRTLQAIQAYQGLPNDASANLSGASATAYRQGALETSTYNNAAANANAAAQAAGYGGITLARNASRWFGTTPTGGTPPINPAQSAPGYNAPFDYSGGSSGAYGDIPYVDAQGYYRHGGVIRPRYAEGGPISGPGTATSDSIKTRAQPGSFILSSDTVRAIGTKKVNDMMEKAGIRPGMGGDGSEGGVPVALSTGEYEIPRDAVRYYGEEFFTKLQQKYHRPVAQGDGMANGGVIRKRGLPRAVEDAIFSSMPARALGMRR